MALAAASGVSVAVRLGSGFVGGRAAAGLSSVAFMLAIGCTGSVVLAAATSETLVFLGGVLAIGIGSGWQGLFMHSYLGDKARAVRLSGVALASGGLGAATGPALFTLVWQHSHIRFAWLVDAALYLAAAALLLTSLRQPVAQVAQSVNADAKVS
jgi:hypothetical protein